MDDEASAGVAEAKKVGGGSTFSDHRGLEEFFGKEPPHGINR